MNTPGITNQYIDSLKGKYAIIGIDSTDSSHIVIKNITPRGLNTSKFLVGDEKEILALTRDYLNREIETLPDIYEVYLNTTNPLVIDAKGNLFRNIPFENQTYSLNEFNGSNKLIEIAKSRGYDSIIINNVIDIGGSFIENDIDKTPHSIVAVFEPNQIKSVDNLNPTDSEDIWYSLDETDRELDTKDLIALHNLNSDSLEKVLDLGGLADPSVAITLDNISYESFGAYSIILDKYAINPRNSNNKVYESDVYSPRFPTIEYDIDLKALKQLRSKLTIPGQDNDYTKWVSSLLNNLEDKINRSSDGFNGFIKSLYNDNDLKYIYAKNNVPEFKEVYKESEFELRLDDGDYSISSLRKFNKKHSLDELINLDYDGTLQLKDEIKELVKENYQDLGFVSEDYINDVLSSYDYFNKLDWFISNAKRLYDFKPKNIVDTVATNNELKKVNQQDFEKWIRDTFTTDLIKDTGIVKPNVDYLRADGSRKTFKQTHSPYTLENVVKEMKKNSTVGGEKFFYGAGSIRSELAKRFKTIEEIRAARKNIVDHETFKIFKDKSNEELTELASKFTEFKKSISEYDYYTAADVIYEIAQKKDFSLQGMKKVFNEWNYKAEEIPNSLFQEISLFLKELSNAPTEYFEAKLERPVYINEFRAIVAPDTITKELRERINSLNIPLIEYESMNQLDRVKN